MSGRVTITVPTAAEMVKSAAGICADGHPQEKSDAIVTLLKQRQFDPTKEPPPIRPIYTLAGHIIATPGNLVAISSTIKTGKSAVIGAMAASVMAASKDADLLGFLSSNPKSYALLHFDSEQSPDDHWHQVNRALKRAGLREPPKWFYSYCLTGLGCKRAWECVTEATHRTAEQHGGIHSSLIDGVADLVNDVNDPAESNAFVAGLHDMAIQHDCPIIGVIHFNPGGEKTRGHLGSQLERKAETNLRLDKEKGITTIWSDKQRRAPIPKDTGPCFHWSDEAGMHVTVESRKPAAEKQRREELMPLADAIFLKHRALHYADIIKTLTAKKGLALSERTAARRISEMSRVRVIEKSAAGLWTKAT